MNERINGLWWKARIGYNNQNCDPEVLEKFAELIIRECAEVCMKEIDIGWAMAPKSPWMTKQILENFGLEE